MTPEQEVKAKWASAYCRYVVANDQFLGHQIVDPSQSVHGYYFLPISRLEPTETDAWLDAASRLRARETE